MRDESATLDPGRGHLLLGATYLITYTRDRWVALRRDTRQFLSGHTLDELEAAICADYGRQPVAREFDQCRKGDLEIHST